MIGGTGMRSDRPFGGIGYMVLGMVFICAVDAMGKYLVGSYSLFQILLVRGVIALILLAPVIWRMGGLRVLRTRKPWMQLGRATAAVLAMFAFFSALHDLPLADVTAVSFAGSLVMTALSVPLLKERVGWRRWAAILVGFLGVVVLVQPGSTAFHPSFLYALAATVLYALMMISARWMATTETNVSMVFYLSLLSAIVGGFGAPFFWVAPSALDWLLLAGVGLAGLLAHLCLTQSFRIAPVAVVAPFEYSALLWATGFGLIIWGDLPGMHVWIGSAILIAAGLYILYSEARAARHKTRLAEASGVTGD
ncbi:MAG: DMT family transporter [Alphaproteobacteria bacterium]|nr:DMT family transporter [Alphaproteobacteria bacterium]